MPLRRNTAITEGPEVKRTSQMDHRSNSVDDVRRLREGVDIGNASLTQFILRDGIIEPTAEGVSRNYARESGERFCPMADAETDHIGRRTT